MTLTAYEESKPLPATTDWYSPGGSLAVYGEEDVTRLLAVTRACGPNVQAVARSLTPPMLGKQFIQQIVRLDSSSTAHHEVPSLWIQRGEGRR